MLAYRFKITFENNDEFIRDVELATDQSFYDFYNILMENLSLDKELPSSFYLCDHKFRKKRPIFQPGFKSLLKVKDKVGEANEQEEKDLYMDKCILSEFVDDPHQKFLFIYDLPNDWSFYIELIKIVQADNRTFYPKVVKALAHTPSELVRKAVNLPGETDDEEDVDFEPDDDMDPNHDDIHDEIMEEHEEETSNTEVMYDEEDLEDFNDDEFYSDSIDMDGDLDESKQ
jgi:hypothetical protein